MSVSLDEAAARLVWRVLDDEAVILDLSTGYYFSLNPVATEIWTQLQAGDSPASIVAAIAAQYGIDAATVQADVDELLAELRAAELWGEA